MHSGPFGCLTILGAKWAELVQKVRDTRSRRNFSQRTQPIHPIGPYTDILVRFVHLVASEPFGCLTKLGGKRTELVQMLEPRSCVRIFRNERTRSTPLDPKLMFWCISYYFGAFGIIFCPTILGAKWVKLVKNFVP